MSNVSYRFEGDVGYGTLADGTTFFFDADQIGRIKDINWYFYKTSTEQMLGEKIE